MKSIRVLLTGMEIEKSVALLYETIEPAGVIPSILT